ncbi:MAG: hypothetical protein ACXACU_11155, partial [Candidatus Hodarchaeales archaeon]|jgi:hypothetical protein
MELAYDTEIILSFSNTDEETNDIIAQFSELIKDEVLAIVLEFSSRKGFTKDWAIQDSHGKTREVRISLEKK